MKIVSNKMYLLLIDEEAEIKEGDRIAHLLPDNKWYSATVTQKGADDLNKNDKAYKVIGYYPLTKEAKELEELPLLPNPFENSFDITKWAKEEHKYNHRSIHELSFVLGCEVGYEKAQSKQFSLEDMKNHIQDFLNFCSQNYSYDSTFGWYENGNPGHRPNTSTLIEKYIQSLSTQQLPKEFIPDYEEIEVDKFIPKMPINILKTITNSEGKQEIVGTYKY